MKNGFLLFFLIIFSTIKAQDTIKIPKGVVYKKASTEKNEAAKKIIKKEFNKATTSYELFDKLVYIGPMLWKRYRSNPGLAKIVGGDIQFKVPNKGVISVLPGKLIQNIVDFKVVWNQILADGSSNKVSIRKLNSEELKYYWSVIFYDIEEPLFIVNTGKHNFLIQFLNTKLQLLWVDEVL
jgi:hypothetical protein